MTIEILIQAYIDLCENLRERGRLYRLKDQLEYSNDNTAIDRLKLIPGLIRQVESNIDTIAKPWGEPRQLWRAVSDKGISMQRCPGYPIP